MAKKYSSKCMKVKTKDKYVNKFALEYCPPAIKR